MSSSHSAVGEQTIALQLKIHGKCSERSLKKWLLDIQGVRRVHFDLKNGLLIISGTIEPSTLLMMLESYGVKAEILGRSHIISPPAVNNKEIIVAPQSNNNKVVVNPYNDPDITTLLEHLPARASSSLKTILVTKTIKFSFLDDEEETRGKKALQEIITNMPHGGGGGLCGASSSCCSGHHRASPHCCCTDHYGFGNYGGGFFPMQYYGGFPPLEAPPWQAVGVPSAPPLPEDDNFSPAPPLPLRPPPPFESNPFYTAFSDDNTSSSCIIM